MLSPLSRYQDVSITTRESLQPLCDELAHRDIDTMSSFQQWLTDVSDLESIIQEDASWRYIHQSCNTADLQAKERYEYHLQHIQPHLESWNHLLNQKIVSHPLIEQLSPDYGPVLDRIRLVMTAFHADNIPLNTQCEQLSQEYMAVCGGLTIEHESKTLTMQQAGEYLERPDRELRRTIYDKQVSARLAVAGQVDDLLTRLVALRHQMAITAGFETYIEYKYADLGRMDYTPGDCQKYADAVQQYITPLYGRLLEQRKQQLGVDVLKPYDLACDPLGRDAIPSFGSTSEMMTAVKTLTHALDPRFEELVGLLEREKLLDLETRPHKQPGGYNTSLLKSGLSFIFSNSANNSDGLNTLLHELGHAMHSYRMRHLPYYELQQVPMEIAEVASMSMEWLKNDYLELIYTPEQAQRLKEDKIRDTIHILCHVAVVDRFQDRLYRHPDHTIDQRHAAYQQIYQTYRGTQVDWTGYEEIFVRAYHRTLHIREVPLYYIEYAIAELGAIGVCINVQQNKKRGLDQYFAMLDAGYTRPLDELYRLGGTQLGFDAATVQRVAQWLEGQMKQ